MPPSASLPMFLFSGTFYPVDQLPDSDRGEGGFGSTGR